MRGPVSLGYLLARFSDTIADAPGLEGNERHAWLEQWRNIIRGHRDRFEIDPGRIAGLLSHEGERVLVSRSAELIEAFRSTDAGPRELLCEVIDTILTGQIWDLEAFAETRFACRTGDDLLCYADRVAGSVGEFWTKIAFSVLGSRFACPDKATAMRESGRRLGEALQLVNILRDLREDRERGRCYLPADELRAAGWRGEEFPTAEQIAPVFSQWLGICRRFLDEADEYVRSVRDPRVRFCTRLPRLLAGKTLDRIENAGVRRVLEERIRVSRSEVLRSATQAVFC